VRLIKLCAPLMGLILLLAAAFPLAAAAQAGEGSLHLQLVGLPRGEAATLSLQGPPSGGGDRIRRQIELRGGLTLKGLPAGLYRIRLQKVKIDKRHEEVERGAVASPVSPRIRVRVRPGRTATASARYGTIVDPDVHSATGDILRVVGDPTDPSAIVLRDAEEVDLDTILSAPPSADLPQGLLVQVTSVSEQQGDAVRARVDPVGIYDVAPNMSFDIPLSSAQAAQASAAFKCEGPDGSSINPFIHFEDVHLTGGWTTTRVLWTNVTNGARVQLSFRVGTGLDVEAAAAFSCKVELPALSLSGMAGPIPVFGAIAPELKGEIAAQGKLHTEGSTGITLGSSVSVPGGVSPIFSFDDPRFDYSAEAFAGVKAQLGLEAQLGIGDPDAANLHLGMGNELAFSAGYGKCSWDLDLGSFSMGGQVGPFEIQGPESPPLYHRNLWERDCG
jgi:hypothetical protein